MIKPKWITKKDLDKSKIKPELPPAYNVALQYGYDILDPAVKKDFQDSHNPWYSILGWDEECCDIFWNMLYEAYIKNWKETVKWTHLTKFEFKKYKSKLPTDYVLNACPTSVKEVWEKQKR